MTKEFIPYEQALALKELGFDENCFRFYSEKYTIDSKTGGDIKTGEFYLIDRPKTKTMRCPAPLYQQAFRWFREKHDLQFWLNDGGYLGKCFVKITGYKHDKFYFSSSEPMEYEEAEQACLEKLIEIVKLPK